MAARAGDGGDDVSLEAEHEEHERARMEGERGITRAGECRTGVLGRVCVEGGYALILEDFCSVLDGLARPSDEGGVPDLNSFTEV